MSKLPKGWSLVELSNICSINMGQSPKSESYNENNIGLPLIQGNADIKNRKTFPRTYTSEVTKECEIGDIIMTVRAPVGAIAKSYHNACIGRGVCSITPKENNDFLYHFLVGYEDKWDKLSQGSTFTAVNGNDIKKIKLPLPPLEEQKKIADILNTVDKKIAFVEENINATEELKKGLMQKLLTEGIGHTEFKDSELGRIPENWELKRLNSVCNKITDGSHFSPIANKNTGFYIATVKDMLLNTFNINTCTHIEENDFKLLEANGCKPENGDILFSKDGTIGKTFVYKDMEIPLVVLSSIAIIKPIYKVLDSSFTMHVLKSNIFYKQLNGLSSGSALKRVVLKAIKEIRIPLPSLEEQKQIAEILSTVDNKLENLKEKKQSFEELKKGLMQKLLTGEVRV